MSPLEEFTRITVQVIREDGLDGYLPTILHRATKVIRAIDGIPEDVEHHDAIQNVIAHEKLEAEEFFFGVQTGPKTIITGHHTREGTTFMTIIEANDGYVMQPLGECPWWRIHP